MRKNPADPGQSDLPDPVSQRRTGLRAPARAPHIRSTGQRAVLAALALGFLLLSTMFSLSGLGLKVSYASVLISHIANGCGPSDTPTPTDCTPTPTDTPTTGPTPTNTPTTGPTAVPTKKPTKVPTKVPTQSGVTATPTSAAQATATAGASPTSGTTDASPTPGTTATSTTATGGNTGGNTTPTQTPGSGAGGSSRVVVIVGGVVVLLLLGLLVGWFFFRRMLLPQGAANGSLPPSGARPWSRTRVPNPDSMSGLSAVQKGNAGPGGQGNPNPNGFAGAFDNFQGAPMNNGGFSGPGPQGGNGAGFGGFSDGFIPPSPQIFQQSENSMIPPGSGAFPVIGNANGFAPASQAFNAMYGLPDDPFSGSQAGGPSWMSNLNNNGSGGPPPANNQGSFAPGQVDLNDPQLAEIIRQYSQKSQSVQPPPPQAQQQQMAPNRPPQVPPGRPPQRPPQRPQQPPPSIPQREPRTGFQDSNWLQ